MWNLPGFLVLFSAMVVGGSALRTQERDALATIHAAGGRDVQVRVKNTGEYFCPARCRVDHRHQVHDVRWQCAQGLSCDHYLVLHVSGNPEEEPPQELLSQGGPAPQRRPLP